MATEYDQLSSDRRTEIVRKRSPRLGISTFGERVVPGVPMGAEPEKPEPPEVTFQDINRNLSKDDTRVKILVPPKYITEFLEGPNGEIANIGGILFPYTPSVSYEAKAEYAESKPLHSNFSTNFYQRSSIGTISISGKFSVENADDAVIYLSTMHLLKSLTRMRFGFDPDAGAPPPVCRLYANGEAMLHNVPVAITSYRIELPDSVDYFTISRDPRFGTTAVPVVSTIAITCVPMYSRAEMQKFSVADYNDGSLRKQGYI
jgi:hypothetical protein